jgi:hypothetical protein
MDLHRQSWTSIFNSFMVAFLPLLLTHCISVVLSSLVSTNPLIRCVDYSYISGTSPLFRYYNPHVSGHTPHLGGVIIYQQTRCRNSDRPLGGLLYAKGLIPAYILVSTYVYFVESKGKSPLSSTSLS